MRTSKKQTLNYRGQTDGHHGGRWVEGWVKQVMGIKESTCRDEHWVMYASVESLYCPPETNITLCVNYRYKILRKKEKEKEKQRQTEVHK